MVARQGVIKFQGKPNRSCPVHNDRKKPGYATARIYMCIQVRKSAAVEMGVHATLSCLTPCDPVTHLLPRAVSQLRYVSGLSHSFFAASPHTLRNFLAHACGGIDAISKYIKKTKIMSVLVRERALRYQVASGVVTGLFKISPDFRSKKINKNPGKEKSSNLQISPKLTPKCGIILH